MKKTKIKDPTFYILAIGAECFFILSGIAIFLFSKFEYGTYYYSLGEFIMNFALREIVLTFIVGLVSYIFNCEKSD